MNSFASRPLQSAVDLFIAVNQHIDGFCFVAMFNRDADCGKHVKALLADWIRLWCEGEHAVLLGTGGSVVCSWPL